MQANPNSEAGMNAAAGRRYAGTVAIAAAAMFAGVFVGMRAASESRGGRAYAQDSSGLVNPADQRRQLIAEMRRMNDKLDGIQSTIKSSLGGPVDVAVVKLPKNVLVAE